MRTVGEAPRSGYRGYDIHAFWLEDHWAFKVFFHGEWVDTFTDLEVIKTVIDGWLWAP